MKVYSYITRKKGKIPAYQTTATTEQATLSYWSTNGKDNLLSFSDAVLASYKQIDERAEKEGLKAWFNGH